MKNSVIVWIKQTITSRTLFPAAHLFLPGRQSDVQLTQPPMASMLQQIARRAGMAVKTSTPEAWETTSQLRSQYIYTTMEAMPARVAEASKEWSELRSKIVKRDFTINEIGVGALRALELYCFYLVGRAVGSKSLTT